MANKDDHWFKFYYRLIVISTQGWKDDEFGAYVKLLIHQFDKGGLPDSPQELSKLITSFKKNWPMLSFKFQKGEDGFLRNKLMKEIREERDSKIKKGKENGVLGGRPKNNQKVNSDKPKGFENERESLSSSLSPSFLGDGEGLEGQEYFSPGTPTDLSKSNLFRKPVIPTKSEVWQVFSQSGGTKEMAKSFYDKHTATGWFINGSPIVSYPALAQKFIDTWNRNGEEKYKKEDLPAHMQTSGGPKLEPL